jgi:zinc transport system ATP-binding protein
MNLVDFRDVGVRFDGGWILESINLQIPERHIMAVVGPNGGGKTTLLRVLLGLLRPTAGEVTVFGGDPAAARRQIGYLPQVKTGQRDFPVSVMDVVLMGAYPRLGLLSWPGRAERQRAAELLGELGVGDLAGRPFSQLSSGQQQRAGIARALIGQPRLLVLDEPSTGVDVVGQETFYRFLAGLRDRRGITVIMVTHDIGAVSAAVDSVVCLNRRVHYYGDPGGAFTPEVVARTFGPDMHFLFHQEGCRTCGEDHRA